MNKTRATHVLCVYSLSLASALFLTREPYLRQYRARRIVISKNPLWPGAVISPRILKTESRLGKERRPYHCPSYIYVLYYHCDCLRDCKCDESTGAYYEKKKQKKTSLSNFRANSQNAISQNRIARLIARVYVYMRTYIRASVIPGYGHVHSCIIL